MSELGRVQTKVLGACLRHRELQAQRGGPERVLVQQIRERSLKGLT